MARGEDPNAHRDNVTRNATRDEVMRQGNPIHDIAAMRDDGDSSSAAGDDDGDSSSAAGDSDASSDGFSGFPYISSDEDAGEQGDDDESVAGNIILPVKRKYAADRVQDRTVQWGT